MAFFILSHLSIRLHGKCMNMQNMHKCPSRICLSNRTQIGISARFSRSKSQSIAEVGYWEGKSSNGAKSNSETYTMTFWQLFEQHFLCFRVFWYRRHCRKRKVELHVNLKVNRLHVALQSAASSEINRLSFIVRYEHWRTREGERLRVEEENWHR